MPWLNRYAQQEESDSYFQYTCGDGVEYLAEIPVVKGRLRLFVREVYAALASTVNCSAELAAEVCSEESEGDDHKLVI